MQVFRFSTPDYSLRLYLIMRHRNVKASVVVWVVVLVVAAGLFGIHRGRPCVVVFAVAAGVFAGSAWFCSSRLTPAVVVPLGQTRLCSGVILCRCHANYCPPSSHCTALCRCHANCCPLFYYCSPSPPTSVFSASLTGPEGHCSFFFFSFILSLSLFSP